MKIKTKHEGFEFYFNEWIPKNKIINTNKNQIIIHPFNFGVMILQDKKNTYLNVFNSLGITKHSLDACCHSAIKLINSKIDKLK